MVVAAIFKHRIKWGDPLCVWRDHASCALLFSPLCTSTYYSPRTPLLCKVNELFLPTRTTTTNYIHRILLSTSTSIYLPMSTSYLAQTFHSVYWLQSNAPSSSPKKFDPSCSHALQSKQQPTTTKTKTITAVNSAELVQPPLVKAEISKKNPVKDRPTKTRKKEHNNKQQSQPEPLLDPFANKYFRGRPLSTMTREEYYGLLCEYKMPLMSAPQPTIDDVSNPSIQ
eukprot:GEZU01029737.1.p1 GENE.GEZU01029737.1~~GEZU01029737.1.p1  ORF type:complete len:226 (-),score=34.14 GEZU01029737.1:200-877(-)